MSYNANVKLIYTNNTDSSPSQYFPEMVDQQTIVIEAPAQDLNVHQYFSLFKSFLRAIDFNEYSIIDGAARLAFNDCNDEAQMKKLMIEDDKADKVKRAKVAVTTELVISDTETKDAHITVSEPNTSVVSARLC